MPISERHIPLERSAVLKHCRVCDTTKHICAFSQSAYTYCNSVCNVCYQQRKSIKKSNSAVLLNLPVDTFDKHLTGRFPNVACFVDKLLNGVSSDSDTVISDDTSELEVAQYVVPYSKWIAVELFDVNAFAVTILVGKVVPSSF